MGLLDAGGALSVIGDVGSSIVNAISQNATNQANIALTHEQWGRDDNAMQRRVKDLVAAGLNPALAAGGSGAQSSAPIQMQSPVDIPQGIVDRALVAQMRDAQRTQTEADASLARLQAQKGWDAFQFQKKFQINPDAPPDSIAQANPARNLFEWNLWNEMKQTNANVGLTFSQKDQVDQTYAMLSKQLELLKKYGDWKEIFGLAGSAMSTVGGAATGLGRFKGLLSQ